MQSIQYRAVHAVVLVACYLFPVGVDLGVVCKLLLPEMLVFRKDCPAREVLPDVAFGVTNIMGTYINFFQQFQRAMWLTFELCRPSYHACAKPRGPQSWPSRFTSQGAFVLEGLMLTFTLE